MRKPGVTKYYSMWDLHESFKNHVTNNSDNGQDIVHYCFSFFFNNELFKSGPTCQLRKFFLHSLFLRRIFIIFSKRLLIFLFLRYTVKFAELTCLCSNESWRLPELITRQRERTLIMLNSIIVRLTRVSASRRYMRNRKRINTGSSARRSSQRSKRYFIDSETRYIRAI